MASHWEEYNQFYIVTAAMRYSYEIILIMWKKGIWLQNLIKAKMKTSSQRVRFHLSPNISLSIIVILISFANLLSTSTSLYHLMLVYISEPSYISSFNFHTNTLYRHSHMSNSENWSTSGLVYQIWQAQFYFPPSPQVPVPAEAHIVRKCFLVKSNL